MFTFFFIFTQINMEASLAAAIKLGKMWYIKQQELNIIKGEKQKLAAVDSGKIQPVFLVNALDKIVDLSVRNPYIIPQMISKIKPLLLYMIYDINQPKVDLKKELHLMEDFVELEKVGIEGMEVRINISGNADHEMIAPFLILPLVENCFRQLSRSGIRDKYINLEATTEEGVFSLWIKWNKPVDSSTLINNDNTFFKNIGKRLKLLYPQSHELKIFIEAIEFRVHMKIDLNRSILNV
jgi:LytS/YehU family sensor histidine kinase